MTEAVEYAPEYTVAERVRLAVSYAVSGACIVLASELWLFPAIREFASTAHCRQVVGFAGADVLAYGLFVGMPLFLALVIAIPTGLRGAKILASGQIPPLGEKVLRKTRVRCGQHATLVGLLHFASCTPLIAIAVWSYPEAAKFSATVRREAANPLIDWTANGGQRFCQTLTTTPLSADHRQR